MTRPFAIDDLDRAILAMLPEEGAKVGKYLPDARTSQRIKRELDDPFLSTNLIGRRMVELKKHGLAVLLKGDSKIGWQKTEKGKAAENGRVPEEAQ